MTDTVPALLERRRATLIGLGAVFLWALLAPLAVLSAGVPPFLLTGMAFLVGGGVGLGLQLALRRPLAACFARQGAAWLLAVGALFGYHLVYFLAMRRLPPVDALLIINLWPLLIILLSALLPGERLRARHVVGGLAGLAGTALIVLGNAAGDAAERSAVGYVLALTAALVWSGYSTLNRRVSREVPTDAMTGFCLAAGLLALAAHGLLEPPFRPAGAQWLAILALGLGPVGAAFYCWDHGTKHGDLRVLGASAYAGPLLGTCLLLALGYGEPGFRLVLAAALIVGGALLASGDLWRRPTPQGGLTAVRSE